ncbi:MAG: HupE/UreJ family protein, partial [Pseudomonadota bacterium]
YVGGRYFYRFDKDAASANPTDFGKFLLRDVQFSVDGRIVEPVLRSVTTVQLPAGSRPPTGRSELEARLRDKGDLETGYVSELAVVVAATIPGLGTGQKVGVKITAPGFVLPPNLHVANRYTDHRSQPPESVTEDGFWPHAVTLSGNPVASFTHFTGQGVVHVLGGLDHLLFVICLGLAASSWRRLVFSVTGFTLGHSVTLSAGVFGFLPKSAWFIPTVELGVAVSIVAMAALVLARSSGPTGFAIATALGLLHGFGFAFMLTPMLGDGDVLLPLAAFNVGIELGQLLIVLPLVAALLVVDRMLPKGGSVLRLGMAGTAAAIALVMTYDRTETVISTITETTSIERLQGYAAAFA